LWARLGEAYAKGGKQVASLKALYQALEIAPDMWMCYYHIGNVQQQLGAYGQAISSYERILQHRPQEAGVVLACSEAWLALGKSESTMGLRERAYHSSLHSLERVATIIPSTDLYRRTSWKIFADACLNVVSCVSDEDDLSEALATIQPVLDHLQEVDTGKTATVPDVVDIGALMESQTFGRRDMLKTAIAAFAYRADLLKYDTKIAELPLYDLACAAHLLATELIAIDPKHSQIAACQKAAIIAIRNALDVDASSPTLWNAFGVIAASASAQLAQHAYVISLQLEPKVLCLLLPKGKVPC
jgi:superkiller protein 3